MRPVLVRRHRAQLNCVRPGAGSLGGHGTVVAAVATGQRIARGSARGVPVARRLAAAAFGSVKVKAVALGLCCRVPRAHVLTARPMGCIWRLQ
eukprot:9258113-Heterocapsa_arctica.AAC.1